MKKIIHSKNTLVFFLCLILHLSIQAQTHKYFIITGKIISDTEVIADGSVHIIKNNKPAIIAEIPGNGHFRLELDYNSDYLISFVEKGYLSKTVHVNTEIPQELDSMESNYPQFAMSVRLYKDNQDAANLYTSNLIQQISYSPEVNNFIRVSTIFDQKYVEKGNSGQNKSVQLQYSKSKLNTYRTF
jgi:hypothetical protein